MSFKFPTVYDALFAKSMAKKKNINLLGKIESREAYFLGASVGNPYMAEVIPLDNGNFNPESTEGFIITAKSQQGLAKGLREIQIKEKSLLFPPGAYNVQKEIESKSKSKSKKKLFKSVPTVKPTKLNETNIGLFLGKDTKKEIFSNDRTAKIIFEKRELEKLPFSKIERSKLLW